MMPWKNLPQSTKLLLVALLFASAVALWYTLFYLPAQAPTPQEGSPFGTNPVGETAPAGIEALPIPFMARPKTTPPSGAAQPEGPASKTAVAGFASPSGGNPSVLPSGSLGSVPGSSEAALPPDPFVPLYVAAPPAAPTPSTPSLSVSPSGSRGGVPRSTPPLPQGAPVRVAPGQPLPTPKPAQPSPPSKRLGTPLPLPQVVQTPPSLPPLPEAEPALALAPLPLQETLRPLQAAPAKGPQASGPSPVPSPAATPLQAFVAEKELRLSGVILGPVSVVILNSKEGYQVLPVGSTWPGSEVLIRSATSESVELALKDETLTLSLSKEEGGGR